MNHRMLLSSGVSVVMAAGFVALASAAGQAPGTRRAAQAPSTAPSTKAVADAPAKPAANWKAPRTPWGDPDLQGTWNNGTITPLERPRTAGEKELLSKEEEEEINSQSDTRADQRLANKAQDVELAYNQFWWDRGASIGRTSLIIDPKDGRIPPVTPNGQKLLDDRAAARRGRGAGDSYTDRPLQERCILYHGVPPLPTGYNNNYEIVQAPGLVAILHEEIHETRLIPLDGRPHVPSSITQWLGDSRGHWEGDTLVVETTNFRSDVTSRFPVDADTLRVIERFRRISPNDIDYQFTVDNPTMYTRPWTATLPMRREDGLIYEYACHEGNYAIAHVLAGFRTQEIEAKEDVVAFPIQLATQAPTQTVAPCVQQGNTQYVCGQTAPEDLVLVPGSEWVVASVYGGTGGIRIINTKDKSATIGYPTATAREELDRKTYDGCPGPPDAAQKANMRTHGLAIREGRNLRHTLYVVNHTTRESIEVFELDTQVRPPSLTWIGCAVVPDPIGLNSVVPLPDGGFIGTDYLARNDNTARARMQAGEVNGALWQWHTGKGWTKVAGSEASGPNGLELSKDGKTVYLNAWGSQSFLRLSLGSTPAKRDMVQLDFRPDNVRWAPDGSLLVTGQGGTGQTQTTRIVKINPDTLRVTEVLTRPNTPEFGAGTVAIQIGRELWIGSYRGDRLAVVPAP